MTILDPAPALPEPDIALSRDGPAPLPGLSWAFSFDRDGVAHEMATDQPVTAHRDGWLWLHFNLEDPATAQTLKSLSELPPAAADLFTTDDEHQQLHAEESCVYGIFASLVSGEQADKQDIGYFHFAMTERMLVSARRNAMSAVDAARAHLTTDRKFTRVGVLLETIIEHVVDAIDDYAADLAAELDRIEESILSGEQTDELKSLGDIRRTTVRLHRQITISHVLIHHFERDILPTAKPALRLATKRLGQQIDWLDGELVALRERAHLLQEEIVMTTAEQTNRHLQVLAIVATIFLPATLIAGIFGMNVKGLPLTDNPWGFVLSMILLAGTSALVVWLLKRSGILNR